MGFDTDNFRDVFLEARDVARGKLLPAQELVFNQACATNTQDHPRLWKVLEHTVAHKYERMTGVKIPKNFNWDTILQWIVDNWQTIATILVSIIVLFL